MKKVRRKKLDDLRSKVRAELRQRAFPPATETKGGALVGRDVLKGRLFPLVYTPQKDGPKPALPIDKFIRDLGRAGRLRPLNEGEDKHHIVLCPYWIARAYVYRAYEAAEAETTMRERERRGLQEALNFDHKVEFELQKMLIHRTEGVHTLWLGNAATDDLKKLIASVQSDISTLEQQLSREPSAKGDVWKICFARTLGHGWRDLVGAPPAPTAEGKGILFLDLVRAAFETLGGRASEKWERASRTAIEQERRRPVAEQWDCRRLIRERPIFRAASPGDLDASTADSR